MEENNSNNEKKSTTYIPKILYNGESLNFKEVPITINEEEPFECPYCKEEITAAQIKHVVPKANDAFVTKVLKYINKYRKDYKLDTCLRKAHFISQIGAEMLFREKYLEEGSKYHHSALHIHSTHFSTSTVISDTVLNSLENHLTDIFKITDKDGKIITKTNTQLKKILKDEKVTVNERKLYGYTNGKKDNEENLKTVKKKEKNKEGKEVEVVDFNIVLKKHKTFGVELLSRAYAGRYGNGDEMSRDGYIYRGKGLKQITFHDNLESFSKFRKNNPFPDDTHGDIDFTEVTDRSKLKSKSDLLADSSDLIFAVQSALWYWMRGNGKIYTYSDSDKVYDVSRRINGGNNGLNARYDNTLRAREESGFKVYKHYQELYNNGTQEEKDKVVANLEYLSKDLIKNDTSKKKGHKKRKVNLKDPNASVLLDRLQNSPKPIKIEPIGINLIPLESIISEQKISLKTITFVEPEKKKKKKKKKKNK
ncbi:hypothetical protein [Aquimarina litoralis]|uniref:hypothetical protein n=1 Tax=Aquimarina litoralis TaxID=584605 RepID=UPI001C591734|nr:hypothetical protein [Aquimarina litoralis]MBW1297001.1 hypothetical protein [Aquimarina litoralis]